MRSPDSCASPAFSAAAAASPSASGAARVAVLGAKAEEAQDAQVVLADALARVADEAHALGLEIGIAAERIVHRAVGVAIERVHGEVAPHGVLAPVGGERHLGVAAERLDVAPQRRHLERNLVGDDRHRAVLRCRSEWRAARRAAARRMTSSGSAVVAMSTSLTGAPMSVLRTAPPTARASAPSAVRAANTARVGARVSHSASAMRGRAALSVGARHRASRS